MKTLLCHVANGIYRITRASIFWTYANRMNAYLNFMIHTPTAKHMFLITHLLAGEKLLKYCILPKYTD